MTTKMFIVKGKRHNGEEIKELEAICFVDSCKECPALIGNIDTHFGCSWQQKTYKDIEDVFNIPEWCPLEDWKDSFYQGKTIVAENRDIDYSKNNA